MPTADANAIFDDVGITNDDLRVDMFREAGQSGLDRAGGIINEEFLHTLLGPRAARVYKEMSSNDPVISGMLHVIDMLIRQTKWHVEPGESEEAAQLVEECMHDMADSWEDTISEILSMLPYGFSFHEIVYKKRLGEQQTKLDDNGRVVSKPDSRFKDGKVGWHRLAIRAQDTIVQWSIDSLSGQILGAWQQAAPTYKLTFIPMDKALLFRASTHKNNPEGKSILRGAYRPWYFKKRIEEIEAIGIERDLAGLPMAFIPVEYFNSEDPAKSAIFSAIQDLITGIRRDEQEGVIFPTVFDPDTGREMFRFELMSSGGQRQFDTSSIIQRYDQRITMAAMADFLLVGHTGVGSFALHDDKTDLFAVATGAWLDQIAAVLNRQAVPQLLRLNGIEVEDPPRIVHGDIESPDLQKIVNYLSGLSSIGMPLFPDDTLEEYLREIAHLPEKDPDSEAISPLTHQRDQFEADQERKDRQELASEVHREEDKEQAERHRQEDREERQTQNQTLAEQSAAEDRKKVKKMLMVTGDLKILE